jgi:hypothetical protein
VEERERLIAAIEVLSDALNEYADPEFYFGISVISDPPSGGFADDVDDKHEHPSLDGPRFGKRAREALRKAEEILNKRRI